MQKKMSICKCIRTSAIIKQSTCQHVRCTRFAAGCLQSGNGARFRSNRREDAITLREVAYARHEMQLAACNRRLALRQPVLRLTCWLAARLLLCEALGAGPKLGGLQTTDVYLNFAAIRFQREARLTRTNSAFLLVERDLLVLRVKALRREFRAAAVRDRHRRLDRLARRGLLDRRPPGGDYFVGRLYGERRSVVIGYVDRVNRTTAAGESPHAQSVFCGLIRSGGETYHLEKVAQQQVVIMYRESDLDSRRLLAGVRRLFRRLRLPWERLESRPAEKQPPVGLIWPNAHRTVKRNLART